MTKNPLINSLSATAYIILIVSFIQYGTRMLGDSKTIFIPIMMLSLLVLSAAMMSYFFFFQPVQLYLDGEKKQAVSLFTKTIAIFAATTLLAILSAYIFR